MVMECIPGVDGVSEDVREALQRLEADRARHAQQERLVKERRRERWRRTKELENNLNKKQLEEAALQKKAEKQKEYVDKLRVNELRICQEAKDSAFSVSTESWTCACAEAALLKRLRTLLEEPRPDLSTRPVNGTNGPENGLMKQARAIEKECAEAHGEKIRLRRELAIKAIELIRTDLETLSSADEQPARQVKDEREHRVGGSVAVLASTATATDPEVVAVEIEIQRLERLKLDLQQRVAQRPSPIPEQHTALLQQPIQQHMQHPAPSSHQSSQQSSQEPTQQPSQNALPKEEPSAQLSQQPLTQPPLQPPTQSSTQNSQQPTQNSQHFEGSQQTSLGKGAGVGGKDPPSAASPPQASASAGKGKGSPPPGGGKVGGKPGGKPPGKGPPPPPTFKGAGLKGGGATGSTAKKSNLVNLHWKVVAKPPGEEAVILAKPQITELERLLASLEGVTDVAGAVAEDASSPADVQDEEVSSLASRRVLTRRDEPIPASWAALASQTESWETAFALDSPTQELPVTLLEKYFKAREAVVKMRSQDGGATVEGEQVTYKSLIDNKRLQMLGITLRKHLMAHRGQTEAQAIFSIKRAVLRCDYDVVRQEGLCMLRGALKAHASDGNKITAFVNEKSEQALERIEHPEHHRLIYELLKIPQIDERLECMLFETAFEEALTKCNENLLTLRQALEMLTRKRELLKKLFTTAHRLGQSLNRDSRVSEAPRGFTLSTLEKLVQTKSTKSPKHNILHFVLALMRPNDVNQLFAAEDTSLLARAKTLTSSMVHQDSMELVQSFYGVREICETGTYKNRDTGVQVKIERRRKTRGPSASAPESQIDADDLFHDHMEEFVEDRTKDVQSVAAGCCSVFQMYKELAVFFDDVASVYPPPQSAKDSRVDLVAVIHRLAEDVWTHRQDVIDDGLREQLAVMRAPPAATARAAA